VASPTGFEPVF